jgi:DNA-binding transcriptional MerR regulator
VSALEDARAAGVRLEDARRVERDARLELTAAIQAARVAGFTLAQIGEALGLTRQRVEQLSRD